MGYGRFTRYFKSAIMLQAQRDMALIQIVTFPSVKKEARDRIWRSLKNQASEFIEKQIKDYRDVMKTLALNLMRRNG